MTKQKRFLNFRLPAELFEQLDAIFWWGQKQRVLVNWVRIFCAIWDLAKSEKRAKFLYILSVTDKSGEELLIELREHGLI